MLGKIHPAYEAIQKRIERSVFGYISKANSEKVQPGYNQGISNVQSRFPPTSQTENQGRILENMPSELQLLNCLQQNQPAMRPFNRASDTLARAETKEASNPCLVVPHRSRGRCRWRRSRSRRRCGLFCCDSLLDPPLRVDIQPIQILL